MGYFSIFACLCSSDTNTKYSLLAAWMLQNNQSYWIRKNEGNNSAQAKKLSKSTAIK